MTYNKTNRPLKTNILTLLQSTVCDFSAFRNNKFQDFVGDHQHTDETFAWLESLLTPAIPWRVSEPTRRKKHVAYLRLVNSNQSDPRGRTNFISLYDSLYLSYLF